MKTIADNEIAARLSGVLDDVEQGETFVVTREGRPIAHLTPSQDAERRRRQEAIDRLQEIRKTLPPFTTEEILSAIREGRK